MMSGRRVKHSKSFVELLEECRCAIRDSEFLSELKIQLEPFIGTIVRVRCLAIGSFYEDFPARFQMAFLLELVAELKAEFDSDKKLEVSIYDPVFTLKDKKYIESLGEHWMIEEVAPHTGTIDSSVLFFLPHAPLSLTEEVLKIEKPTLLLANNIISHTDRYTKQQLFEKYPQVSKLLHLTNISLEQKSKNDGGHFDDSNLDKDGFQQFVSAKKNRNRRKKFVEKEIDYNLVESYFEKCEIASTFQNGQLLKNKAWNNSFSDLALHVIL